jgi:RING finger and CCCH-type zinc finger domain-containing protein
VIALQRTGDPGGLSCLRPHLDVLAGLDPSAESDTPPDWNLLLDALKVYLYNIQP